MELIRNIQGFLEQQITMLDLVLILALLLGIIDAVKETLHNIGYVRHVWKTAGKLAALPGIVLSVVAMIVVMVGVFLILFISSTQLQFAVFERVLASSTEFADHDIDQTLPPDIQAAKQNAERLLLKMVHETYPSAADVKQVVIRPPHEKWAGQLLFSPGGSTIALYCHGKVCTQAEDEAYNWLMLILSHEVGHTFEPCRLWCAQRRTPLVEKWSGEFRSAYWRDNSFAHENRFLKSVTGELSKGTTTEEDYLGQYVAELLAATMNNWPSIRGGVLSTHEQALAREYLSQAVGADLDYEAMMVRRREMFREIYPHLKQVVEHLSKNSTPSE